jgi:hypothetical protein
MAALRDAGVDTRGLSVGGTGIREAFSESIEAVGWRTSKQAGGEGEGA